MRGGLREGAGRPAGVPNRATLEIKQLVSHLNGPAVARLGKLIESSDDDLAFKACELVLAYSFGKPKTAVDLGIEPKRPTLTVEELEELGLSDYQLRRLAGLEDGRSY